MICRPSSRLQGEAGHSETPVMEASYVHLTPAELAERWRLSPRTLERWRQLGTGPEFHKMSGKVTYAINDVETFERRRRTGTDLGMREE